MAGRNSRQVSQDGNRGSRAANAGTAIAHCRSPHTARGSSTVMPPIGRSTPPIRHSAPLKAGPQKQPRLAYSVRHASITDTVLHPSTFILVQADGEGFEPTVEFPPR